jgi:hypothetical protein
LSRLDPVTKSTSKVMLSDIMIGDLIEVSPSNFEPVLIKLTHNKARQVPVLTLHLSSGHSITLTPNHLVHSTKAALHVKQGDQMHINGQKHNVTTI